MNRIKIEVKKSDDPSKKVRERLSGVDEGELWVKVEGGPRMVEETLFLKGHTLLVKQLDLSCNDLDETPEAVCTFLNLAVLCLNANQLTTLPEDISRLVALKELGLRHNKFTAIPLAVGRLRLLERLMVGSKSLC